MSRTTNDGQLLWKVVLRLSLGSVALLGLVIWTLFLPNNQRGRVALPGLAGIGIGATYIVFRASRNRTGRARSSTTASIVAGAAGFASALVAFVLGLYDVFLALVVGWMAGVMFLMTFAYRGIR